MSFDRYGSMPHETYVVRLSRRAITSGEVPGRSDSALLQLVDQRSAHPVMAPVRTGSVNSVTVEHIQSMKRGLFCSLILQYPMR